MDKIFNKITNIMEKIDKCKEIEFCNLKPTTLREDAGVYIIQEKKTKEVFYVGRTINLSQRLYTNHLQGNLSTARLKKYLVEDNQRFPNIKTKEDAKEYIKNNCSFKYIKVKEYKERGHIEGLLGYMLNSYYIEKER